MDLMGISDFARLSRLSPLALRLYDERGLGGSPDGPQSGRSACQLGHIMPRPVVAAVPLLLRFHRMPVLA